MSNIKMSSTRSKNIPSGNLSADVTQESATGKWYASINAKLMDVVGKDSDYTASTGQLAVTATAIDTESSATSQFKFRMVATLNYPTAKVDTLPPFNVGGTYYSEAQPLNLNPYPLNTDGSSSNPLYLKPVTLKDGMTGIPSNANQLHFALAQGNECSWMTMTDDGKIYSSKAGTSLGCHLLFTVTSDKINSTQKSPVISFWIPTNTQPASWNAHTVNGEMKFDTFKIDSCTQSGSDCMNLTAQLKNPNMVTPDMKFSFSDGSTVNGNWQIKQGTNGNYYLIRNLIDSSTIDAKDVGAIPAIKITVNNVLGSDTATFNMTVKPHADNVNVGWRGGKVNWIATPSGDHAAYNLNGNFQTTLKSDSTIVVQDIIHADQSSCIVDMPADGVRLFLW